MTTPQQPIRRRTGGTVDLDSYRQRALAERAAATFPKNKRLLARTLIAAAMTVGPASALIVISLAVAGLIHIVTSALSGPA